MSFPRYPEYKASGVEWLGDVPGHWSINRFKCSIKSCRNGIWGDDQIGDENDMKCVRVADFDRQKLVTNDDIPTIRNVSESERQSRILSQGNLLLEKSGGGDLQPVGFVVLYDRKDSAICSNFMAKIELTENQFPSFWRYCHFAAYAVRLNYRSIKQTSGIQNLDQSQYFNESAPYPPYYEQQAIADFLDRETAKIDGLIEEQRRLVELLKEKRQAVISHAVTKGLNPNAPMKPSGIEWLGDIPEHWEVQNLKRVFKSVDYGISESLNNEGLIGILRMGNIKEGKIDLTDMKYVSEVDKYLVLEQDDLLYNRTNSLDLIGKVGLFESQHDQVFSFASYLVRLRTKPSSNPRFFSYLLNTEAILTLARSMAFIAIGQCNLNPTRYGMMPVAVPPLDEQSAIVKYIHHNIIAFDTLISEAEKSITLLQERRTALISAAVTGKIDVRGLANAEYTV
jgi:type I restriction enzyme S subunit